MMKIKDAYKPILILSSIFWAYYITVYRGIRWPNEWAIAHWLINYKWGFIKRAFPGTLISPLIKIAQTHGYLLLLLKVISIFFFIIFSIGILWLCFSVIKKSNFQLNSILVVMVFLTSPFIVMSAHLIGYFDNIIVIISILSGLLIMKDKIFLSAILLSLGILIHETILAIGFPCVIFLALIKEAKASSNSKQILIGFLKKNISLVLFPVLTISFIYFYQFSFLNPEEIKTQLMDHLSQFNFLTNKKNIIFSTSLTTSFQDYLRLESPLYFSRIISKIYFVHNVLPLLIILGYGWYAISGFPSKKMFFSIFTIISFIPLALHFIASDTSRIWTYPIVVSIIAIWEMSIIFPENFTIRRESPIFEIFAIMVTIFNFFMQTPLMDNMTEHFSIETRIFLYAPILIIIAIYISNYYRVQSTANKFHLPG